MFLAFRCLQCTCIHSLDPLRANERVMGTSREWLSYRTINRRPLTLLLRCLWRDIKQPAKCRCSHCCWVRWIPHLGSISIARGALRSSVVTAWLPTLAAGCNHTAVSTVCVGRAELPPAVGSPPWAGQTGQRRVLSPCYVLNMYVIPLIPAHSGA